MKKITISFFKGKKSNYGDELGPFIVRRLTNEHVQEKNLWVPLLVAFKNVIKNAISGKKINLDRILFPFQKNVLTVGSILSQSNYWSIVWGSGFMSENESYGAIIKNIKAVRGLWSLRKIRYSNPSFSCCLGDPGLLLPLVLPRTWPQNKNVAIVPHFKEYQFFLQYKDLFDIIDLTCSDVEKITKEITSHKYILSTSLHGLIIAHAYGIPALWMEYSGLEKDTNGFKFFDYFSSVGLDNCKPIKNIKQLLTNEANVVSFFERNITNALPQKNTRAIQRDLLSEAPFEIKKCYRNIINNMQNE